MFPAVTGRKTGKQKRMAKTVVHAVEKMLQNGPKIGPRLRGRFGKTFSRPRITTTACGIAYVTLRPRIDSDMKLLKAVVEPMYIRPYRMQNTTVAIVAFAGTSSLG